MKIWDFTPATLERVEVEGKLVPNLGKAYNEYMELVPNDTDWVILKDRDVMFIQPDYLQIIAENLHKHRNVGLFTCLTNRVGNKMQLYQGRLSTDASMLTHFKIGQILGKGARHNMILSQTNISGVVMIIQKSVWQAIGGADDGVLGIDNKISYMVRKKGYRVGILQGLYVLHFYRLNTTVFDKSHLNGNHKVA